MSKSAALATEPTVLESVDTALFAKAIFRKQWYFDKPKAESQLDFRLSNYKIVSRTSVRECIDFC